MALTKVTDAGLSTPASDLQDNEKIVLGTGNDLQIYHDGSNSHIKDSTDYLFIYGNNGLVLKTNAAGTAENAIRCINNGSVELYYDNAKKFETVTGGATITGVCTATSFAGDGSSLTGLQAGATGGNSGANAVFWENEQTVTHDYTISNNKNAGTWGPVTINSGVTVTIGDGEYWTIM
jgi:hypothetical protein